MSAEHLSLVPKKDYDRLVVPPIQVVPERCVMRFLRKVVVETAGKRISLEGQLEGVYMNPGRRTFKIVTRENGKIFCRSYSQDSAVYYPFICVEEIKRPSSRSTITRVVA